MSMIKYIKSVRQIPVLYIHIIFSVLIAFGLLRITPPAYAHILLTDGSIGAVVHVNPEDDPIIGEMASFFFEFKDKENKFVPAECDCHYSLEKDGKILVSGNLFAESETPSLENASFSYTFSEKGLYSVVLTGKPKERGAFQTFRLEDSIRVEREKENNNQIKSTVSSSWFIEHNIHFIVFGAGLLIALAIIFSGRRKKT